MTVDAQRFERILKAGKQSPETKRAILRALDKFDAEASLLNYCGLVWHTLEPLSRKFVPGWHLEAICEHLEAVSRGEITRLLMNVPPGLMKSLTTDVLWPAWEWGPRNEPWRRYVAASYSERLTVRDNQRFLRLVTSDLHRELWGERFRVTHEGVEKVQNDQTGWKIATSVGGLGTGERGDRVIVDDPHNVVDGESEVIRARALYWFQEAMPNRVNDPEKSAFVVIMQRVHQDDISGFIQSAADQHGYTVLMLPMRYDPQRHCSTGIGRFSQPTIGEKPGFKPRLGLDCSTDRLHWTADVGDPRTEEGELIWPERMPEAVVQRDERIMGPYAVAAQHQQAPAPRGGGIIKRDWWQLWPPDGWPDSDKLQFPPMDYVLASLDTAMSTKQTADWSACTVWGSWRDEHDLPKLMLMGAWTDRLAFNDLVEKAIATCRKHRVDQLIIEAKANGLSVAQEIHRLCHDEDWGTSTNVPRDDKLARVYAIQHLFSGGLVFAPDRKWADKVISQCEVFPKGKHDDLVDTTSQALSHLRKIGLALLREERKIDLARKLAPSAGRSGLPYDV